MLFCTFDRSDWEEFGGAVSFSDGALPIIKRLYGLREFPTKEYLLKLGFELDETPPDVIVEGTSLNTCVVIGDSYEIKVIFDQEKYWTLSTRGWTSAQVYQFLSTM